MPSVLKIRKTNGIHDTGLFFSSSGVCQELGRGLWGQEELDGFGEAAKEGGVSGQTLQLLSTPTQGSIHKTPHTY